MFIVILLKAKVPLPVTAVEAFWLALAVEKVVLAMVVPFIKLKVPLLTKQLAPSPPIK